MSDGKIYLANAFSLSMLPPNYEDVDLHVQKLTAPYVAFLLQNNEFISAIGHETTAKVLSKLLGVDIPANRSQITLQFDDTVIVAQILVRLEEGKILSDEELQNLIAENKIAFYAVTII